ncbi:MAG: hypothetical protein JST48_06255 [Bacteroidetes bacterium]|nr:hypothetical protein [Bacteroidota bacterium]
MSIAGFLRKIFQNKSLGNILLQVILIFIGVLAALAVENFKDSVADRQHEKEYLFAFRDALSSDTAMINLELIRCHEKLMASKQLLALVSTDKAVSPEDFDAMSASLIMLIHPVYNLAIYEDLKSSSNLRLITNSALRTAIILHYTQLNDLMQIQLPFEMNISYNHAYTDQLTYEEFTFEKESNPKAIIERIRKKPNVLLYLQQLQKDVTTLRNTLLHSIFPRSLDLLDKINEEINYRKWNEKKQ